MIDVGHHAACVDAWLERTAKDLSPEDLLRLLEAALNALWAETQITLGVVTLTAITERVIDNAAEKFPRFSSLKIEPTGGVSVGEWKIAVRDARLLEGSRFVLVEFLTVIGNLTAEILTPELHSELGGVALPDGRVAKRARPTPPNSRGRRGHES